MQFKYIDLKPDPKNESCHASFWNVSRSESTAKYVERDGQWHHLAVSWSVEDEGLTKIYWDGLLVASAYTHKTKPLEPGGAFMLGAEQVKARERGVWETAGRLCICREPRPWTALGGQVRKGSRNSRQESEGACCQAAG